MTDRAKMPLDKLVAEIIGQLRKAGFSSGTIGQYVKFFERLKKMSRSLGKEVFDQELARSFIEDSAHRRTGEYCHSRYLYHVRCVRFIESYIQDGLVDWSIMHPLSPKELKSQEFRQCHARLRDSMEQEGLKPSTMEGYLRFVYYFLSYLEDRGYTALSQVHNGDITVFIVLVCQEHYAPTSLGSHITGLRRFVGIFPELEGYASEIPENLLKKQDITSVYTEEEHKRIDQYLMESGMSERNRAISLIAFETGLRAVDICKLELSDIDWKHDTIHIRQEKTGKALDIPIRPALGNALAAYLLEERPPSDSAYVFLRSVAPYRPLTGHSGIYNILRQVLAQAGVEPDGRISGTRMARHSYASRMLRNGVPLHVISEALGHSSPDSTLRYLSTDSKTMAECTLPLPKGGLS